jgi:hypothetical protein
MLGALLVFLGSGGIASAAPEYRIKAAFLYNLARMVEWPNENVLTAKEPFVICFIGEEPFGEALDALNDKQVRNRPISLRKDIGVNQAGQCAMLFISPSEDFHLEEIVDETEGLPLLTVGDVEGFAARGVMINLLRDEKKIKLEVNLPATEKAGLILSPTLLELAVPVEQKQ